MKSKRFPQVGDYVTVITAHDGLEVGWILKTSNAPDTGTQCTGIIEHGTEGSRYAPGTALNFRRGMVEPTTRERRAEIFEASASKLEKQAKAFADDAKGMRERAKRLRDFSSDAAEIAAAVKSLWSQKELSEAKRMKLLEDIVGSL